MEPYYHVGLYSCQSLLQHSNWTEYSICLIRWSWNDREDPTVKVKVIFSFLCLTCKVIETNFRIFCLFDK